MTMTVRSGVHVATRPEVLRSAARDRLRSLLVLLGILSSTLLATSLVVQSSLGIRAGIAFLVIIVVGAIIAKTTDRI